MITIDYLRGLGPPIPSEAQVADIGPVRVKAFGVLADLNGWGEAIAQLTVEPRSCTTTDQTMVLLLFMHPYTLQITRCHALRDGAAFMVPCNQVPPHLLDLVATRVSEMFPRRVWSS